MHNPQVLLVKYDAKLKMTENEYQIYEDNMVAFGTVVYGSAMPFFDMFFASLKRQTYLNFDIIIVNDDIENSYLQKWMDGIEHRVILIDKMGLGKTPAELRVDLLRCAKQRGYDLLVIGDCDDWFHEDRVKELAAAFQQHPECAFFYNELLLPNGDKALKSFPIRLDSVHEILQHNFVGLSNSAINLNRLSDEFLHTLDEYKGKVFDWYLFSRILCNGGRGVLVSKAISFYRLHQGNIAGISRELQFEREYEIKTAHYSYMKKYSPEYQILLNKLQKISKPQIHISSNEKSFWWDNILL